MINIFAQGGSTEEIVCATLDFESLHRWENIMDAKREVNWNFIAEEYRQFSKFDNLIEG